MWWIFFLLLLASSSREKAWAKYRYADWTITVRQGDDRLWDWTGQIGDATPIQGFDFETMRAALDEAKVRADEWEAKNV